MKAIASFAVIFSLIVVECIAHGHRSRSSKSSGYNGSYRSRGHHTYHHAPRASNAPAPTPAPTPAPITASTTVPPFSIPTAPLDPATHLFNSSLPVPPNVPRAAPDAQKSNEGFVVTLVDKFVPNKYDKYNKYNKHDDKYDGKYQKHDKYQKKQYEKKYYNKYNKNSETCYEIITSDNSYSSKKDLSFKDISGTGTSISFASPTSSSASVAITGTYYFFDEELPASIIVTTSGSVVLDPNSLGDRGSDSSTPNLGNRDATPYAVISPFWSAFTLTAGLNTGTVYYEETDNQLIVQWNVNELNNESSFGGVFQVRFCEDGKDIVFAYQQLNCKTPATGAAEFGVKPYQPGFSKGQRSSFRISSCINQAYQFPRDNTGVWMKPTKCEYLVGQTGIRKPTEKKQKYDKHYNYDKHDNHGKNDKHEQCSDIDDYFHNFMDSLFHKH